MKAHEMNCEKRNINALLYAVLGEHNPTISEALAKFELSNQTGIAKKKDVKTINTSEIIKLRKEGYSIRKIAAIIGSTKGKVAYKIKKIEKGGLL